uniref:SHSP domain-containing protein n=1 Tax=Salarias fasciatus TaxID=181472 RepID=A0A672IRK8_SALFA
CCGFTVGLFERPSLFHMTVESLLNEGKKTVALREKRPGAGGGGVQRVGDSYCTSVDVSQFEPHDIVVMAYNHHVVVHAQKVLDDGSVSDTFTHKSLFPEDMDPLSVCGALNPDGTLVVTVRRIVAPVLDPPPIYRSEAHL